MSTKSRILVYIQFSCFAFFAFAGNLFITNYWLALQLFGLVLGIWGVLVMKLNNFNIQPEVKSKAVLISKGPYRIIRNPMYAGLLLFFGISVILNFNFNKILFSTIRFSIFLLLTFVLILKIGMEEKFLKTKFGSNYLTYKKKTYRLIPYIF